MDILFSRAIKAGKRIYYVDVKQTKGGEMYLALTESKKVRNGEGDDAQVSIEKHKIFLYREDFEKVMTALNDAVQYVEKEQGKAEPRPEYEQEDIKIDVEF